MMGIEDSERTHTRSQGEVHWLSFTDTHTYSFGSVEKLVRRGMRLNWDVLQFKFLGCAEGVVFGSGVCIEGNSCKTVTGSNGPVLKGCLHFGLFYGLSRSFGQMSASFCRCYN